MSSDNLGQLRILWRFLLLLRSFHRLVGDAVQGELLTEARGNQRSNASIDFASDGC